MKFQTLFRQYGLSTVYTTVASTDNVYHERKKEFSKAIAEMKIL